MEQGFVPQTWRRILAYFIDQMLAGFFYLPVILQMLSTYFHEGAVVVSWGWLGLCFALNFSYQVLSMWLTGATIGKLIFGLRVVSFHARGDLQFSQSFLRVLADRFSWFFGQSFRALAMLRFDRRHVSDWVAETMVVQLKPRGDLARPHVVLGSLLFVYLFANGFFEAYDLVGRSEWTGQGVAIHPALVSADEFEAGPNEDVF